MVEDLRTSLTGGYSCFQSAKPTLVSSSLFGNMCKLSISSVPISYFISDTPLICSQGFNNSPISFLQFERLLLLTDFIRLKQLWADFLTQVYITLLLLLSSSFLPKPDSIKIIQSSFQSKLAITFSNDETYETTSPHSLSIISTFNMGHSTTDIICKFISDLGLIGNKSIGLIDSHHIILRDNLQKHTIHQTLLEVQLLCQWLPDEYI